MFRPYKVRLLIGVVVLLALAIVIYSLYRPPQKSIQPIADYTEAFNGGDIAAAIDSIDRQIPQDPQNPVLYVAKAGALAQEGNLASQQTTYGPRAILEAQKALALDPKNDEAWRMIGYAYESMQNYPAAHAAYEKAIALNPKNAAAISADAHAYDLEGDLVKAERGYRKALSISPSFAHAHMGLGRILVRKGNVDDALQQFQIVFRMSANARLKAEAAYSSGVVESGKGNRAAAENSMSAAIGADASYAPGWTGLGAVLFSRVMATSSPMTLDQRNTMMTASIDHLKKAISLDPNQSDALIQLGIELATVGQTKSALQILAEAKRAVPEDISLAADDKTISLQRIDAISAAITHP